MAPKKAPDVHIALTDAPGAAEAVSLVQQAQGLVITNKASHELCREFLKGAKALKKKIEDHYAAIKAPLNAARATVLDMEKRDLAPVLAAISEADRLDTRYVSEQRRIEAEADDARRRKAEADETARREKEAADAEAAALKLEASSNVLSERERNFVDYFVNTDRSMESALRCAKRAGYKDPHATCARFMILGSKIFVAIANADKAETIRREAALKAAKPVIVDVPQVESQIVDGGMRVYYSCSEDVDVMALAKAVVAGKVHVLALSANLPYLNVQAKSLKGLFESAFPGCRLSRREGTVSR